MNKPVSLLSNTTWFSNISSASGYSSCLALTVMCNYVWTRPHFFDLTHHSDRLQPLFLPRPSFTCPSMPIILPLGSVFIAICSDRLCLSLHVYGCYRWGKDGCVLMRQQQQQQPVETQAGWFITPYWEHKSHLQRRAFKRPAFWQHLPFINDWAEPPMEPETTKLTHSPPNSSFVSPLSLCLISIFSPYLHLASFSPQSCFSLPSLSSALLLPPVCPYRGLPSSVHRAGWDARSGASLLACPLSTWKLFKRHCTNSR